MWKIVRCDLLTNLAILASAIAGFLIVYVIYLLFLVYCPVPDETNCQDIDDIVIFAPAFTNLGKNPSTGKYDPGGANLRIAKKIKACGLEPVLTQKAVSDVFPEKDLPDLEIEQMHRDIEGIRVDTLEALLCGVKRIEARILADQKVGLLAHPKHMTRSHQALAAALELEFPDNNIEIIEIHLGKTPYQGSSWFDSWCWGAREIFAKPYQSLRILFRCFDCPDGTALKTISNE